MGRARNLLDQNLASGTARSAVWAARSPSGRLGAPALPFLITVAVLPQVGAAPLVHFS